MKWDLTLVYFRLGSLPGLLCRWRGPTPFPPCKLYDERYARHKPVRMHDAYQPGHCPILRRRAVGCCSLGPQQATAAGRAAIERIADSCQGAAALAHPIRSPWI
jgi:hypothetical protein